VAPAASAVEPAAPPTQVAEPMARAASAVEPAAPPPQAAEPSPPPAPPKRDEATAPASPPATADAVATTPSMEGDALPLTLQGLLEAWPAVLQTLRSANALLGAVIEEAEPVALDGSRLVLAFAEDAAFQRQKAEDRASRTALARAVTQVTGCDVSLDYESRAVATKASPPPLSADELAKRFMEEFDGEELTAVQAEEEDG